jgi:hypothetical protein
MISNLDEDCWCQKSCQKKRWNPGGKHQEVNYQNQFLCVQIYVKLKYEIQISDSDHSDSHISNYV